jgi:hypothetical protein
LKSIILKKDGIKLFKKKQTFIFCYLNFIKKLLKIKKMNMKNISSKVGVAAIMGAAFIAGSIAFAAATIPAACSTPGTCTDLSATFQAVVAETSLKLTDADNSNFVELKSPATVVADVTLTLPDTAGTNGQILSTDGTGILSWISAAVGSFAGLLDTDVAGVAEGAMTYFDGTNWVDLPKGTAGQSLVMNTGATAPEWASASPDDRFLGMIAFMIPNASLNIYEINGQTVTDAKLATYITANPITGFSVSGNDVTLPDWRGRYLGANDGLGINDTAGSTLASANKRHRHSINMNTSGALNGGVTMATTSSSSGDRMTTYEGDTYARPETVGMPIVIIGGSN